MYPLSRSLYRELAPLLISSAGSPENRADRQYLLDACEEALRRLVLEPDGCAHPIRSLFRQIRHLFPLGAQLDARSIVRLHVDAGRILAARLEATLRRECQAFTRKGTPCRREARPGQRFCPSHRHLDEVVITEDEGYPAGQGVRLRAAAAG